MCLDCTLRHLYMEVAFMSETQARKTRADFGAIYHEDNTCHQWDCRKPGVVLAYDEFTPESACWFCERHWSIEEDDDFDDLVIIEDLRPKPKIEPITLPVVWRDALIESIGKRYSGEFINMTAADIIKQILSRYDLTVHRRLTDAERRARKRTRRQQRAVFRRRKRGLA